MTDSTIYKDLDVYPCGCTKDQVNDLDRTASGIHYSEDGSMAARHDSGKFFAIDSDTKLATPLDKDGFFRVEVSAINSNWLWVQYRVERKFLKRFNFKWLSSREVCRGIISIGEVREVEQNDIINVTLNICEFLQKENYGNNKSKADNSTLQKWVGDYPPKNLPITDMEN